MAIDGKNTDEKATDGRFARSARTREELISSLLRLIAAGNICPTAEQVGIDAGISKRAVFRHFDDMDALNKEVWLLQSDRLSQRHSLDGVTGNLQQRINSFTLARCALLQDMAPFRRAVIYQSKTSKVLAQALESVRDKFRMQVHQSFAVELEQLSSNSAMRLSQALALMFSFSSFDHLYSHQQLTLDAIIQLLQWQAQALIDLSFAEGKISQ